jgi:hypothetical protein
MNSFDFSLIEEILSLNVLVPATKMTDEGITDIVVNTDIVV